MNWPKNRVRFFLCGLFWLAIVPTQAVPFDNGEFNFSNSFIPVLLLGLTFMFLGTPMLLGALTFFCLKRRYPDYTSSLPSTILLPCVPWGIVLFEFLKYPKLITIPVAVLVAVIAAVGAYFINRKPKVTI
jgi:hypothetical protein